MRLPFHNHRAHGCAQMRAYQTLTETPINEKVRK